MSVSIYEIHFETITIRRFFFVKFAFFFHVLYVMIPVYGGPSVELSKAIRAYAYRRFYARAYWKNIFRRNIIIYIRARLVHVFVSHAKYERFSHSENARLYRVEFAVFDK